jgi:hypothetical protein
MREATLWMQCAIFLLKLRKCPNGNIVRAEGWGWGVAIVALCDVRLPSYNKGYCSLFEYVAVMMVVRPWRRQTDCYFH